MKNITFIFDRFESVLTPAAAAHQRQQYQDHGHSCHSCGTINNELLFHMETDSLLCDECYLLESLPGCTERPEYLDFKD